MEAVKAEAVPLRDDIVMLSTASSLKIDHLYRYQSLDRHRLERMLTHRSLFFANPETFNDPWDCRAWYRLPSIESAEYSSLVDWAVQRATQPETQERIRNDPDFLEQTVREISREMTNAIYRQYRVYCLSRRADSTLMWAHYADSFRGVCLEFAVKNDLFSAALQVEYVSEYPEYFLDDSSERSNLRVLLVKSDTWDYEQEFRVFATAFPYTISGTPTAINNFVPFPTDALRSIILGPLMPELEQQFVRQLVATSGLYIRVVQVKIHPSRYVLEMPTDG